MAREEVKAAKQIPEGWQKVDTGSVKKGHKIWLPRKEGDWRDADDGDIGMFVGNFFFVIEQISSRCSQCCSQCGETYSNCNCTDI